MQYLGLAGLLALIALVLLIVALRTGWRLDWLRGFLKGAALFTLVGGASLLALIGWELAQFRPLDTDLPITVIEFQQLSAQQYQTHLEGRHQGNLLIHGDLWELDVQVLRWKGLATALGLKDGYRLNRLGGRYVALEQQRGVAVGLISRLHPTPAWRDLWLWLDKLDNPAVVEADAFALRFMPMADQARFAIEIAPTGLTPVPLNPPAVEAVRRVH